MLSLLLASSPALSRWIHSLPIPSGQRSRLILVGSVGTALLAGTEVRSQGGTEASHGGKAISGSALHPSPGLSPHRTCLTPVDAGFLLLSAKLS